MNGDRTRTVATRGALLAAAISFVSLAYACEDDAASTISEGAGASAGKGSGGSGDGGDGGLNIGGMIGSGGSGGSCVDLDITPEFEQLPADIVFIIDNSGSMGDEIDEVESNINNNFASIIASSGIDYRVIMITAHGGSDPLLQPSAPVCITQPLSSIPTTDVDPADGIPDGCDGPPGDVPGQFYHYDVFLGGGSGNGVQSTDGLCILLETLYGSDGGGPADEWGLHPEGWIKWLRPEAVKVFVMITDDRTSCTPILPMFPNAPELRDQVTVGTMIADGKETALRFDALLTSLAPNQFGTTADRNYKWYSIVGVQPKPSPDEAYGWLEPVVTVDGDCPGADNVQNLAYSVNTGNQWLSIGTKGLRFPVCATGEYDTVFNSIADGVIKSTAIPCEFDLPPPQGGQDPDLNTLSVVYVPGDSPGPEEEFNRVPNLAACGALTDAFWIDTSVFPNRIHLCPETCERIEEDSLAGIGVRYQCGGID